ncbi:MAG: undecaprenyl-diphosphate phosphatase [Prevotellaceae bacterium]|jgi:undecaprenyl-diphosphatase|nr:undecaprenyl-diphosphate phosphatase [Prevotellaceae bacterium]
MDLFDAIILAIVEGITEFLPISSTGHMIIVGKLIGVAGSSEFVKAYEVIIQFGAILSVLVLYWKRFLQSLNFYVKLFIAVVPALLLGFLFKDYINDLLENVTVVAVMLVLGGVLMLFVDTWFNKPDPDQTVTYKKGFFIGLAQCVALIPGVSRSMASIVSGMAQKFNRKTAAEFSFFLAVPTMAAASGYKLLELLMNPENAVLLKDNLLTLIIGNIVAFIVAMLAIKGFISFLTKYGFQAFGYYRIVIGGIILVFIACGADLTMF